MSREPLLNFVKGQGDLVLSLQMSDVYAPPITGEYVFIANQRYHVKSVSSHLSPEGQGDMFIYLEEATAN